MPDSTLSLTTHNLHAPYLYRTPDGSVLHCACCGQIEIEFRDLSLRLSVEAFDVLCRAVATAWEAVDDSSGGCDPGEPAVWRLMAERDAADDPHVEIVLQTEELRNLYRLVAGAEAMRILRNSLDLDDSVARS